MEKEFSKREREVYIIHKTTELNNFGKDCEQKGLVDYAVDAYEKCISLQYPATHSYDRLIAIYKKLKNPTNELRVIDQAIDVFSKENKRRSKMTIKNYPEHAEEIKLCLELNEDLKIDGKFLLSQYKIFKYFSRRTILTKK